MTTTPQKRLPVTVLTGFLGAGKTTLLNHVLQSLKPAGREAPAVRNAEGQPLRVAVIENEFASAFGVENEIIDKAHVESLEELYEFGFGCVCCSSSGELLRVLGDIARRQESGQTLDWVILETTGLADPGPVLDVFRTAEYIRDVFYVDGIVTVVDARHFLARIDARSSDSDGDVYKNEPIAQVANADRVIINKVDLVDDETLHKIDEVIARYNPAAPVIKTTFGRVGLADVLNVQADNTASQLPAESAKAHDPAIQPVAVSVQANVDVAKVLQFIRAFASEHAADLFRVKGVLAVANDPSRFVVQGVVGDVEARPHRHWQEGETRDSRLSFVGRGMQKHIAELQHGLEAAISA